MKIGLRWRVLASTCLLLTGCDQITGLFGLTAQEQTQVQNIRALKKYIVPATNKPLNLFLRTWGFISDFNLPTEYGVDLSNYISLFPFAGVGDTANAATPLINSNTKEYQYIRDTTNQTEFQFTAASNTTSGPHSYRIALTKSRLGPTGTFTVTTTPTGSWKTRNTVSTTGRYGLGYYTDTPQSVTINLTGKVSDKDVVIRAALSQFNQLAPTIGSGCEIHLPSIDFIADSVRFSSQSSLTMSGKLGIGGTASDAGVFEGDIQFNNGAITGTLNNSKYNYTVSFEWDGSILTATFKGNGNTNKNLAVIDYDEDSQRQVLRCADGGVEELPLSATK